MKHKKWLGATAIVAVLALVATGVVYEDKLPWSDSGKTEGGSQTVTSKGGVHSFPSGIVITVPKGAVKKDTTLTVGESTQLTDKENGPFKGLRSGAVKFDVSLSADGRNDIQPLKPLAITIPLSGDLLPEGAKPTQALLYTANPKGDFFLLQSKVEGGNILKGMLTHLSPKYVSYVSDQELLDVFFPEKVETDRDKCKQEVTISGQKYKIGDKSRGWSLKDDSPLFACLSAGSKGYVRVGIANRIEYMLSVAAHSDVRLAVSGGDASEQNIKNVAKAVFGTSKVRGYLEHGGEMVGSISTADVPSTIELVADPATFFAESMWNVFNLTVSLLVGKQIGGETAKMVEDLLKLTDITSCAKGVFDDLNSTPSVWDVVNGGLKCMGAIIAGLGKLVDIWASWKVAWIGDAIRAIVDTAKGGFNGVVLTKNGTIRVEVVKVVPPFSFVGEWVRYRAGMQIHGAAVPRSRSFSRSTTLGVVRTKSRRQSPETGLSTPRPVRRSREKRTRVIRRWVTPSPSLTWEEEGSRSSNPPTVTTGVGPTLGLPTTQTVSSK
jgi:hypothetical protein